MDGDRKDVKTLLRNVANESTIHGLNVAALPGLHILERIFWLLTVAAATGGAIALAYSNWRRYSANPTVVSIQKDFRNWENPLPSVTGCFLSKVDKEKADKYIFEKWRVAPSDAKYKYYFEFIEIVANVSYKSLDKFYKFKYDTELQNINMLKVAVQVHPDLSGTLVTSVTRRKPRWQLLMSELGICFSVNTKFAYLMSVRTANKNAGNGISKNEIIRCHYLNGLCYARYDSDPHSPVQYYTHSYLDVAHATMSRPLPVKESEELEISYRMHETGASPELRRLSPSQRKCHFDDEPITDDMPAYSTSLCYITCRYRLALELCGCKPFFYHFLGGKICDINGLLCLSQYATNLTKPPAKLGCRCPQPCDLIVYLPQTPKVTKWDTSYFDQRITFRWGLLPPTTKYRRDVLFGFEDLVVSIGGILALFLGISFMSICEIIFLILEAVYIYFHGYRNEKNMTIISK